MRVTTKMMFDKTMTNLTSVIERMNKAQEQLTTGRRINRPSDAPSDITQAVKYRKELNEISQYDSNIQYGLAWLSVSDSALSQISEMLISAKGIGIAQSSSSATSETLSAAIEQIDSIIGQVVNLGNSKYGNRYIFAGQKTDTIPFVRFTAGGQEVVRYDGDNGAISIPDGKLSSIQINQPGSDIFSWPPTKVSGSNLNATTTPITETTLLSALNGGTGVADGSFTISNGNLSAVITVDSTGTVGDVLDAINSAGIYVDAEINADGTGIDITSQLSGVDLSITEGASTTGADLGIIGQAESTDMLSILLKLKRALENGDKTQINAMTAQLSGAHDTLLREWVATGTKTQRLENTQTRLGSQQIIYTDLLSSIEDADLAQVVLNLTKEQNVYQAVLKVTGTLLQQSLLDYLK